MPFKEAEGILYMGLFRLEPDTSTTAIVYANVTGINPPQGPTPPTKENLCTPLFLVADINNRYIVTWILHQIFMFSNKVKYAAG